MYGIRRMMVWASRCRHCRGFGVQSPWAYGFIRYVVNEHYPYYAYKRMREEFSCLQPMERKLCELYFRMANFLQPQCVVDMGTPTAAFRGYVNAGCKGARIVGIGVAGGSSAQVEKVSGLPLVDFARVLPVDGGPECYDSLAAKVGGHSMVVVEGIHSSPLGRKLWAEILNDGRTSVTFDLYYCGIVTYDKKRYRQNYIVNF